MDKLFNWLYNLGNSNVAPDSEAKEQEAMPVDETNVPHQVDNLDRVTPPTPPQDEQMDIDSKRTPVEYIDLISSDDEDEAHSTRAQNMNNIIDLTLDDDDRAPSHRSRRRRARSSLSSRYHDYGSTLHLLTPSRVQKAKLRAAKLSLRQTRKTAKRRWELEMAAKTLFGRCSDCLYKYTRNDPVLSQHHSNGLCRGCFLLHQGALLEGENMSDVFHWLKTGELSVDVWNNEVDNAKEERLVKKRAGDMRSRMSKHANKHQQVATQDDLYDLYLDSECKCAITGWTCHFSRNSEQKFWVVTFDHIVPVSKAKKGVNPWTISNIQVMCHLLNQIKGNYPDEELRRWFQLWKQAHL